MACSACHHLAVSAGSTPIHHCLVTYFGLHDQDPLPVLDSSSLLLFAPVPDAHELFRGPREAMQNRKTMTPSSPPPHHYASTLSKAHGRRTASLSISASTTMILNSEGLNCKPQHTKSDAKNPICPTSPRKITTGTTPRKRKRSAAHQALIATMRNRIQGLRLASAKFSKTPLPNPSRPAYPWLGPRRRAGEQRDLPMVMG